MDLNGKTVRSRSMRIDISDLKEGEIALHETCNNVQNLVTKRSAELVEINARLNQEIKERKPGRSVFKGCCFDAGNRM